MVPITLVAAAMATTAVMSSCGSREEVKPPTDGDAAVRAGFELAQQRSCFSCHSIDGSSKSGPTFKGLAGRTVQLKGSKTTVADDAYMQRAITEPDAEIVDGYSKGVMTAVLKNQQTLTQAEAGQIVAYIKTLK